MSQDAVQAAQALLELLRQENAALGACRLSEAAALLDRKRKAAEAFTAALATAGPTAALQEIAEPLGKEAQRNRALLERGIALQGRVLAIIARAAAPADPAPCYARAGRIAPCPGQAVAIALSA